MKLIQLFLQHITIVLYLCLLNSSSVESSAHLILTLTTFPFQTLLKMLQKLRLDFGFLTSLGKSFQFSLNRKDRETPMVREWVFSDPVTDELWRLWGKGLEKGRRKQIQTEARESKRRKTFLLNYYSIKLYFSFQYSESNSSYSAWHLLLKSHWALLV